ncbi:MAG: hypothetical protein ACI8ZO_001297 [Flavobacteriales bacterium]|jgi:hypothetical protein
MSEKNEFLFSKRNYKLLIAGLALIGLGLLLMIGGGSEDPTVFNPEIFSFTRITLSPLIILSGLVLEIFAIMYRNK